MSADDADREKMKEAFSKIDLDLGTAVGVLSFLKSGGVAVKDARQALSIALAITAGASSWTDIDPAFGVK